MYPYNYNPNDAERSAKHYKYRQQKMVKAIHIMIKAETSSKLLLSLVNYIYKQVSKLRFWLLTRS